MFVFASDISDLIKSIDKVAIAINGNWAPWDWGPAELMSVFTVGIAIGSSWVALSAWKTSMAQARLMEHQHDMDVFMFSVDKLADDDMRQCRRTVYENETTPVAKWSPDAIKDARRVVAVFETVYTVTSTSKWARAKIVDDWSQQIIKVRNATSCLIGIWRTEERAQRLFEPFEKLAKLAAEHEAKRCTCKS